MCDTEDRGDSLLKQYNGHLSPRGVIQIQYQARTFSTPLSALRRRRIVFFFPLFFVGAKKEKAGGQRGSQLVPELREGWKEEEEEEEEVAVRFLHRGGCGSLWIRENAQRAGELKTKDAPTEAACACVRGGAFDRTFSAEA